MKKLAVILVLGISLAYAGYRVYVHLNTVPLNLESKTVTWNVSFNGWLAGGKMPTKESQQKLIGYLSQKINDPMGWNRSGLRFVYKPGKANINFSLVRLANISHQCGTGVASCGSNLWWHHKWVIKLLFDASDDSTQAYLPMTVVVNHEIGHALLGPHHYSSGLMKAKNPTMAYPSQALINKVEERMGTRMRY